MACEESAAIAMDSENKSRTCPSDDEIEAYELGIADGSVAGHVEACQACQERLKSIALLDRMVAEAIRPPEGLAERVKAAVARDAARPHAHWGLSYFAGWRGAAVAVLVVAICAWAYRVGIGRGADESDEAVAVESPAGLPLLPTYDVAGDDDGAIAISKLKMNDSTVAYNDVAKVATAPLAALNKSTAAPLRNRQVAEGKPAATNGARMAESHVAPGDLRLAGMYNSRIDGSSNDGAGRRSMLGGGVTHVWSVDALPEAMELLRHVAEVNGKKMAEETKGEVSSVFMVLADTEVQELVDRLKEHGWSLLSPALPQPGKSSEMAFMGRDVLYRMDLVEREK